MSRTQNLCTSGKLYFNLAKFKNKSKAEACFFEKVEEETRLGVLPTEDLNDHKLSHLLFPCMGRNDSEACFSRFL